MLPPVFACVEFIPMTPRWRWLGKTPAARSAGVCDVCGSGELYLSAAVLVGHKAEEPPSSEQRPRQTQLT